MAKAAPRMITNRRRGSQLRCVLLAYFFCLQSCVAFTFETMRWHGHPGLTTPRISRCRPLWGHRVEDDDSTIISPSSRRHLLINTITSSLIIGSSTLMLPTAPALADVDAISAATITDKIYLDLKLTPDSTVPERLVIGLFGKDSPEASRILKQLVSVSGLPAPCKPRVERQLQREQLEANKVYNACIENESKGVNYDLGTVWRVVKDDRIDLGSVSGKYVSREFVNWTGDNQLRHDSLGIVSVRKGNESGFGFTINTNPSVNQSLDKTHLVVGRVIENMDLVRRLNEVPVVTSAKLPSTSDQLPPAPSRSCRYGGSSLYCSEFKPLQKASIVQSGVL